MSRNIQEKTLFFLHVTPWKINMLHPKMVVWKMSSRISIGWIFWFQPFIFRGLRLGFPLSKWGTGSPAPSASLLVEAMRSALREVPFRWFSFSKLTRWRKWNKGPNGWDPGYIWMFPKMVGFPPKSSIFNRVFHYKPSILGYHYFRKHPYMLWNPIWAWWGSSYAKAMRFMTLNPQKLRNGLASSNSWRMGPQM